MVSGDALTDVDIKDLVAFHKEKGALATIALHRVYDTSEFRVVEVDQEGNILGFQEKPAPEEAISTLANTGVYVFEPRALEYIPENAFLPLCVSPGCISWMTPKGAEDGLRMPAA